MGRTDYDRRGLEVVAETREEFRRACSALIEYSKRLGGTRQS